MTCRVVRLRPAPEQGATLLVGGRPAVVLCLLRRVTAGKASSARCAHDPPCRTLPVTATGPMTSRRRRRDPGVAGPGGLRSVDLAARVRVPVMTGHVVSVVGRTTGALSTGATVLIDGRPHVVLQVLPAHSGATPGGAGDR